MMNQVKKENGVYTTSKNQLSIHELSYMALMVALLSLLAQIAIPLLGMVPFTLQTVGVLAAALLLPRNNAVLTIVAYIMLGLAGLPVFSGGRAGLGILAGPSGGFLYGFVAAAWLTATLLNKGVDTQMWRVFLAAFAAMLCYLTIGTLHYAFVLHINIIQAFIIVALPFLAIDTLKLVVFVPIIWKIRCLLHQQTPKLF
ncbi:MAG: biotin transporter BioY [Clostridiales bacterium]|nr:biotin transporter BioY [Clostridiales bacterium]